MKLKTVFKICKNLANKQLKANPTQGFKVEDEHIYLKDVIQELDLLTGWCYPGELDVQQIVRCKNCKHYKKFKSKNPYNRKGFIYMCKCTRTPTKPEFYCAHGEDKRNTV